MRQPNLTPKANQAKRREEERGDGHNFYFCTFFWLVIMNKGMCWLYCSLPRRRSEASASQPPRSHLKSKAACAEPIRCERGKKQKNTCKQKRQKRRFPKNFRCAHHKKRKNIVFPAQHLLCFNFTLHSYGLNMRQRNSYKQNIENIKIYMIYIRIVFGSTYFLILFFF